ncbi:MAG: hypothetical protein JXQ72_00075 [Anaerolineae bacterium]|nr:hypothetical protein [Anaerolineae bacterium]
MSQLTIDEPRNCYHARGVELAMIAIGLGDTLVMAQAANSVLYDNPATRKSGVIAQDHTRHPVTLSPDAVRLPLFMPIVKVNYCNANSWNGFQATSGRSPTETGTDYLNMGQALNGKLHYDDVEFTIWRFGQHGLTRGSSASHHSDFNRFFTPPAHPARS